MHFCTFSRISPFFYFLLRFLFHFLFEEPHLSHCVYQIFGDWKMSLEHITWHSLQGKIFLQILVSMAPDTLIRWSAAPLIPSHAIGDHVPDSVISSPPKGKPWRWQRRRRRKSWGVTAASTKSAFSWDWVSRSLNLVRKTRILTKQGSKLRSALPSTRFSPIWRGKGVIFAQGRKVQLPATLPWPISNG